MAQIAKKIVSLAAEYYLNTLVSKLIYNLKRAPQEYQLSPDCGLSNLWEEICVQMQTDKWQGYNLVEDYLKAEISIIYEYQHEHIKLILSYSEEDLELGYNKDLVVENTMVALCNIASSYNNKCINKYLNQL